MRKNRVLNRSQEDNITALLLDTLEEVGYTPEEVISGVMVTLRILALRTSNPSQAIDEALRILEEEELE